MFPIETAFNFWIPKCHPGAEAYSNLPAMLLGLADGLNPCVFSIYIFLLSFLVFIKKEKREILIFGAIYLLSVFFTNTFFGAAVFWLISLISKEFAGETLAISSFIKLSAVIILAILISLSIGDLVLGLKTQTCLPKPFVQKIHAFIRQRLHVKQIIWAAIPIGVLVTLFEFPCSGQIYLPYLVFLLVSTKGLPSLGFWINLLVYNLFFILPMGVIVLSTLIGIKSSFIKNLYQNHPSLLRIIQITVMGGLLCLIVFS
ncbi:MAG: hypothetical protein NT099_08490 [Candidatus Saganbacteria bacterium]|nr:hypothetical protein [Candidatus Saganbacteria bacterium]